MSSTSPLPRVAVLGGGITGLTAAWNLQRAGFEPVLLEKSSRLGGAIQTERHGEWLHELGPNSLLEGSADLGEFIDELGLGWRRLPASPAAKQRYVVRDGRAVAMPTSPLSFATTKLFSWRAKLALLGEPWRRRAPADAEESVEDFVVRRLGREFLDYAVNPFVGGVYAGDPAKLSVRHGFPKLHALEQEHGSLIRGALKRRNTSGGPAGRIFSFPDGLSELPSALVRRLGGKTHLNTTIKIIRRTAEAWEVVCERGEETWTEECAAVVSALPATALASLAIEGVPGAERLSLLRQVEHPPVASVFLGFKRADVRHPLDGFGLLMPEIERGKILGTLFSSTLFPGRAPEGHVALTTFVGGMRQPWIPALSDAKLLEMIQGDLAPLLGITAAPVFVHIQRWAKAIPQYTLGYGRIKDAIAGTESATSGLFIGGNACDGISIANCLASGRRLANAAAGYLQTGKPAAVGAAA